MKYTDFLFTWKRFTNFVVTFLALMVTAFVVVIAMPEGTALIGDFRSWLEAIGTPVSVVNFVGVMIAQMYFAWKNKRIANSPSSFKANKVGGVVEYY